MNVIATSARQADGHINNLVDNIASGTFPWSTEPAMLG